MKTRGLVIELFLIDGTPEGMQTVTLRNWSGRVLKFPRVQLTDAMSRSGSDHPGLYILLGEKDCKSCAYIGETLNFKERVKNHIIEKDWWTSALFVSASDDSLNKADVTYLEARLIEEAHLVKSIKLENNTNPKIPKTTETEKARLETFIDNLMMILPAVRVDIFVKNTRPSAQKFSSLESKEQFPTFVIESDKHGIEALAAIINGEFIIQAGSKVQSSWIGLNSQETSYGRLHRDLIERGVIKVEGGNAVFEKSYAFKSASAAAAVVMGMPTNGRTKWKLKDSSLDYHSWEISQVEKAAKS